MKRGRQAYSFRLHSEDDAPHFLTISARDEEAARRIANRVLSDGVVMTSCDEGFLIAEDHDGNDRERGEPIPAAARSRGADPPDPDGVAARLERLEELTLPLGERPTAARAATGSPAMATGHRAYLFELGVEGPEDGEIVLLTISARDEAVAGRIADCACADGVRIWHRGEAPSANPLSSSAPLIAPAPGELPAESGSGSGSRLYKIEAYLPAVSEESAREQLAAALPSVLFGVNPGPVACDHRALIAREAALLTLPRVAATMAQVAAGYLSGELDPAGFSGDFVARAACRLAERLEAIEAGRGECLTLDLDSPSDEEAIRKQIDDAREGST